MAKRLGFVAKLFAEGIEEIDRGQVEAVTATGAGRVHVLLYGIVPQIRPVFAGVCVFRWDINIRESTALGIVGAGQPDPIGDPGRRRAVRGDFGLDPAPSRMSPNFALDSVFIRGVFGSARKRLGAASTGAHAAAQLTARVTGSTLSYPSFPPVSDSSRRP